MKYKREHFTGELRSGYVHWKDLLGVDRYSKQGRRDGVLWHQYSRNEDYLLASEKVFGSKYRLEDFGVTEI